MAEVQPVLNGKDLEFAIKCPICHDILKDPRVFMPCQHMFCLTCILSYVDSVLQGPGNEIKCPVCRICLNTKKNFFIENNEHEQWTPCFPKNLLVSEFMGTFKTEDEYCKIHENKLNEHVCVNHSEVICSDCLRKEHRYCKNVQSINEYEAKYSELLKNDVELLKVESVEQLRQGQFLFSEGIDKLTKLEKCKTNLNSAIDQLKKNMIIAKAKQKELSEIHSKELNKIEDDVKESKDFNALRKCNLDISKAKRDLRQLFDDIVRTTKAKDVMKTLSELQHELTTISAEPVAKRTLQINRQQTTKSRNQDIPETRNSTFNRQYTFRHEERQTPVNQSSDRKRTKSAYHPRAEETFTIPQDEKRSNDIPVDYLTHRNSMFNAVYPQRDNGTPRTNLPRAKSALQRYALPPHPASFAPTEIHPRQRSDLESLRRQVNVGQPLPPINPQNLRNQQGSLNMFPFK